MMKNQIILAEMGKSMNEKTVKLVKKISDHVQSFVKMERLKEEKIAKTVHKM